MEFVCLSNPPWEFLLRLILLGLSSKSSRSCSLMIGGMMLTSKGCIVICGVAKPCKFRMNTGPSSPLRSEEILACGVGKLPQFIICWKCFNLPTIQQFMQLKLEVHQKTVKKSGRNCAGNGRTWTGNGRIQPDWIFETFFEETSQNVSHMNSTCDGFFWGTVHST